MTTKVAPQDSANMAQADWLEVETAKWANGVLAGKRNTFTVTTTGGLGISVNTGDAIVQGFGFWADATTALTCATADPTNPRIDRAVLHADLSAHTASIILLTGTPAPSPAAPALTQTSTVWEVSLYQVRVNASQTTLTGGSLTDERTYAAPNIPAGGVPTTAIATGTLPSGVNLASGAQAGGSQIWTAANDGTGSGLDADLIDGINSANLLQVGSGNGATTPLKFIIVGPDNTHLPAAGTKGRIAFVVPFSLP